MNPKYFGLLIFVFGLFMTDVANTIVDVAGFCLAIMGAYTFGFMGGVERGVKQRVVTQIGPTTMPGTRCELCGYELKLYWKNDKWVCKECDAKK